VCLALGKRGRVVVTMIDPITISVVASLIANGLTTLLSCGIEKAKETAKCGETALETLEADTALISTIQEVKDQIVKSPLFASHEATMIKDFLESPTAEGIVRQIYSNFLSEGLREKSTGQLQKEFQLSLAYHLGVNTTDIEQLAANLFNVIATGCRKALDVAIEQGVLSAHEAKSIARQRVLLDELQEIKSNLDFLTANTALDLTAIENFEAQYRRQVGERSRKITIPHFDRAPMVDINKIFVPQNFIGKPRQEGSAPETLPLNDFLNRLYRPVVLGDPGGGKSTLAQKICYELSKNYEKRLVCGRLLTPVLVVLRDYSSKKKKEGYSIIQFMESEVTSKYQLPISAPPGAFEYLLHNGHILVIFDGLDELLEPSHRREISNDMESFCNLFPSVPVLVTSRVVGYEQAPLDPERFETFNIAPFNEEQVAEYVKKWFDNDPILSPDERKRRAEAFLGESQIVADLRSNPLMLALMCNLYRGAGFIPRNRPEVYKKCSEMLFERWDPSRGIWVHLPITEPKVLLSYLAHLIYSDESLQSGVTEEYLIKESTPFLCRRRFEIEEEAEKASREFIEFCRGRAWVFSDAGTTPEGKTLYKFTHKTFLEYFTATHIVRNNNTPEKLWALLRPKIAERAWDVVAQLAFQMLHEQVEGASDKLLSLLLQDAQTYSWPYLLFGARCLQFIFPSPKTIRALTQASVRTVVEVSPVIRENEPEELLSALLRAAPECRPTVRDSLQSEIINYAKNTDDKVALRAIDLGLTLQLLLRLHHNFEQDLLEYWRSVQNRIFEQVSAKLENFAPHNFLAFRHWTTLSHTIPIELLFEWYTPDHLFQRQSYAVFNNAIWLSIGESILDYGPLFGIPVTESLAEVIEERLRTSGELGRVILNVSLPCFSYGSLPDLWLPSLRHFQKPPLVEVPITWDAAFGLWCLWAAYAELGEEQAKNVDELGTMQSPVAKAIFNVLEARKGKITPDKALQSLEEFNIPPNALEFVRRWITGEISFVKRREPEEVKGES
jgi:hypothetical protein